MYFGRSRTKVAVFWSGLGYVGGDFVRFVGERGGFIRELLLLGKTGERVWDRRTLT